MLLESFPPNMNTQTSALYPGACAAALESPSLSMLAASVSAETPPDCWRNLRREKTKGALMSELQLVLRRYGDEVHRGPGPIEQLLRRVGSRRAAERQDVDRVPDLELHPWRHRAVEQHVVDLLDQVRRVA